MLTQASRKQNDTFERKIPQQVYRSCEEGRIEGKGMKLDATVTVSHSARCKRSIMLSSRIESRSATKTDGGGLNRGG